MVSAAERVVYGRSELRAESRFIEEIDPAFIERHEAENKSAGFSKDKFRNDRINPRDQLKYLKQQSALLSGNAKSRTAGSGEPPAYKGGERVKHSKYGEGMVVGMKNDGQSSMITIIFDEAGTKVFDAGIVKLKRI